MMAYLRPLLVALERAPAALECLVVPAAFRLPAARRLTAARAIFGRLPVKT
jgi:hypothetical protein